MRLLVNPLNPKSKKTICIVHIPKSSDNNAIKSAIEKARDLKIAAERSGYVAQSVDLAEIFTARTTMSDALKHKREQECLLLSVGMFDVIHYSGSGLSSDHLQDIARTAYYGETPVYLDIPRDSVLSRYIVNFKFNIVNRSS